MARPRSGSNTVVCREAIVINVGGHPAEYHIATVLNRRTDQMQQVPLTEVAPRVEEDPGTPYAFKAGERVHKTHPAVLANPGAFMTPEEAAEVFDEAFEPSSAA